MTDAAALHTPVMLQQCVDVLAPAVGSDSAVVVDATLGMGGHTEAMLAAWPHVSVVGIDRDAQAVDLATQRLSAFGERFVAHHGEYDDMTGALAAAGAQHAQGILMDLGVSSLQIDQADRGFSYAHDAPLDMRMNAADRQSAADLLAVLPTDELRRILKDYGEERYAARIAESIVAMRDHTPLTRTSQLVDIVRACIPAASRVPGSNPAKRTFQALRIAVNNELEILGRALDAALDCLDVGGRMVVLSYHSLEDRMVKQRFARGTENTAPVGLPVVPEDDQPYLRALTRGALKADAAEIAANPRAQSVRMRAVERLRETPASLRGSAA